MTRILAARRALPAHEATQDEILAGLRALWAGRSVPFDRVEQLLRTVRVRRRRLSSDIASYPALDTFAKRNAVWSKVALELGEEAVRKALDAAGVRAREVDAFVFTTVTGISVPSVDARVMNRLGFRSDVRRVPIFGLGCVAGTAGVARAAELGGVAVVLSVELCSLTIQRDDLSVANMVAIGLFGDGASAVVLGEGRGPRVVASRSVFYPGTEDAMGWEVVEGGFKIVLSGQVPDLARSRIRGDVDLFLESQELRRSDVRHWICHTGGPKVLEAFQEALEVPRERLERSWRSLEDHGNLSSASVLLVLEDLLDSGEAREGDLGVMISMGPGFCAELVLLEW